MSLQFLQDLIGAQLHSDAWLRQFMTIGLLLNKKKQKVFTNKAFNRNTTLAIEGDSVFSNLVRWVGDASSTNCCVVSLRCDLPDRPSTLKLIVATSFVDAKEALVLCPLSVRRCADEGAWYSDTFGVNLCDHEPLSGWPAGEDYYHGIGESHRREAATCSFPYNLLGIEPCVLGNGNRRVVASHPIPSSTCFLYGGPVVECDDENNNPERSLIAREDTYSFSLGPQQYVKGQSVTRYINHKYNFDRFGNIAFSTFVLPRRGMHSKRRRHPECHECSVTIPFLITIRDVAPGEQLLASTYGDEYDARLERQVFCSSKPFCARDMNAFLPADTHYNGDYQWSIGRNCVVARRVKRCNVLFRVVETRGRLCLLSEAEVESPTRIRFGGPLKKTCVALCDTLVLLVSSVDYVECAGQEGKRYQVVDVHETTISELEKQAVELRCHEPLLGGDLWTR